MLLWRFRCEIWRSISHIVTQYLLVISKKLLNPYFQNYVGKISPELNKAANNPNGND